MLRERCAELTDVEKRLVESFPQHHALHPLWEVRHLGQFHQELLGLVQRNYNRAQSETSGTTPPATVQAGPVELQWNTEWDIWNNSTKELLGLIKRNYNRTQSETFGTAPPGTVQAGPEELQ